MARRLRLPHVPRRPAPPSVDEARERAGGLRRLSLTRGSFVAALLTAALGVALVAQARTTADAGLTQLRQSELVALLDDASSRVFALQDEVRALEADRERLRGQQGDAAAEAAAQERLESYQILAGTVAVQGPGITVRVDDPGRVVTQPLLLDGLQELRDAGAEAIEIGGVRIVASSWLGTSASGELVVDGTAIAPPYRIVAIGDAHTLAGAMAIPGGFSDSLRGAGATVEVVEGTELQITSVHAPTEPQYARPVPSSAP